MLDALPGDIIEEICIRNGRPFLGFVQLSPVNRHFYTLCHVLMWKRRYSGYRDMRMMAMLSDAKYLNLYGYLNITDEKLLQMTALQSLSLGRTGKGITDHGLSQLTTLTNLDLTCNAFITDAGLSSLTNLKILDLYGNDMITTQCLTTLTSLTALNLRTNVVIDIKRAVKRLTNLTHLSIESFQDCFRLIHPRHYQHLEVELHHGHGYTEWPFRFL